MKIAIPKERRAHELRVAVSPDTVKRLVGMGFAVMVESGAGESASFPDASFECAGATVAPDAADRSKLPIYGMPPLDVERAKTVLFVKRSMASGYADGGNRAVLPRQHDDTLQRSHEDVRRDCQGDGGT